MRRDPPGQERSLSGSEECWQPESAGRSWGPLSWCGWPVLATPTHVSGLRGLLAEVAAGLAGEGSLIAWLLLGIARSGLMASDGHLGEPDGPWLGASFSHRESG